MTRTVRILLALWVLGCAVAVADGDNYLSVKQRLYGQLEPAYGRAKRLGIETLDQLPHYRDMRHRSSASLMLDAAVRPTGFFRPEKRDGRWWLIDPYGHQRLSIAVNSVRVNSKQSVAGMAAVHGPARHGATGAIDAWQVAITDLWVSAGFNGFGAWSELSGLEGLLEVKRDYHYAINLNLVGDYRKTLDRPGDYLPVFDPDFAVYARERMRALSHLASDPQLLGYFTDNELAFWYVDPADYLVIEDQDAPAHQAVLLWLSEQELEPEQMTPTDRARFRLFVLEQYLEVVKAAIASVDTNHMILGPRLYGPEINDQAFMRMLGRYVDLVSINFYQKLRPDEQQMQNWEAWTGRPFLISEFSIKAGDSGKANESGAGWLVDTDADRGLFYQHFTLGLLASRNCVGFHWYRYRDSPGKRGVNKGIVNDALEPYPALLESIGAVNRQAYFLVDYFDNRLRH